MLSLRHRLPSAACRYGRGVALRTDLVLEGGGVRGLALVGAVDALAAGGYAVVRSAGSSAGALVAALVAALGRAGEPLTRLVDVASTLDVARIAERGPVGRALGPLGVLADAANLLRRDGAREGRYLRGWLTGVLDDLRVATFGDLALSGDVQDGQPERRRWSLLVTASDVSRRRAAVFPEDYPLYGLDPDEQRVVDAVAASGAIPGLLVPSRLALPGGRAATLLDGGLLVNYPITVFDRRDGAPPRWPTIGVVLAGDDDAPTTRRVRGPLSLAGATVATVLSAPATALLEDPCVLARTVVVPVGAVGATDFGLGPAGQQRLLRVGREAGAAFLSTWDLEAHRRTCRS